MAQIKPDPARLPFVGIVLGLMAQYPDALLLSKDGGLLRDEWCVEQRRAMVNKLLGAGATHELASDMLGIDRKTVYRLSRAS